ncbi:hypothetical protein D3C81_1396800 [compost metagenome]
MLISSPLIQMNAIRVMIRPCGDTSVSPSNAGRMIKVPMLNTTIAATNRRAGR